MTEYSQSCTDPEKHSIECPDARGTIAYEAHGSFKFQMPQPIAIITPDLSASALAAQQQAVRDAIVSLSGGGGSPHEQPLCTLARYLRQDRASLPQNAVFLVMSDEDDQSTPRECLAGLDAALKPSTIPNAYADACTTGCDAYEYRASSDENWERALVTCAAFDDVGAKIAGTDTQTWLNYNNVPSCAGFEQRVCTSDEAKQAASICPAGLALVSCERICSSSPGICSVDLPDSSVDACTHAFTKDGATYADLSDYCVKSAGFGATLHDCTGGGIKYRASQQLTGTYNPVPLVAGEGTRALISDIRSQANTQLGTEHYLVEAIAISPDSPCKLGPGQSYANNLIELVGDPTHVFPLCESYAGALRGVTEFSRSLIQRQFGLHLAADEHITAIHIAARNGTTRAISANAYSYDRTVQALSFNADVLSASDSEVRVEVTADCTPALF